MGKSHECVTSNFVGKTVSKLTLLPCGYILSFVSSHCASVSLLKDPVPYMQLAYGAGCRKDGES